MDMFSYIRESIAYNIQSGYKDFVIYPYGTYGKYAKRVLNEEFGIKERYVVDNFLCDGVTIQNVDYLRNDYRTDNSFMIMIAANYTTEAGTQVFQSLSDFADVSRIADVCSFSIFFNPWNYYGNFSLEKNIKHHVTECIQREIYRNGVEGAVAEAGVYRGNTAKRINYNFPDRKLYLFDTFSGFDADEQKHDDDKGLHNEKLDFTDTAVEAVMKLMPFPQNCVVRQGYFPETAKGIDDNFAFVRLDMDLYGPIMAGLEYFYPRMNPGGVIAVHDCRSKNFDGAREALINFCKKEHLNYVNTWDELGTAVIPVGF